MLPSNLRSYRLQSSAQTRGLAIGAFLLPVQSEVAITFRSRAFSFDVSSAPLKWLSNSTTAFPALAPSPDRVSRSLRYKDPSAFEMILYTLPKPQTSESIPRSDPN